MTSTAHPATARSAAGHLIAAAFVVLAALGILATAVFGLQRAAGPGSAADHAPAWLLTPITATAIVAFVRVLQGTRDAHRRLGRCATAVGSLIGLLAFAGISFGAGTSVSRLLEPVR